MTLNKISKNPHLFKKYFYLDNDLKFSIKDTNTKRKKIVDTFGDT